MCLQSVSLERAEGLLGGKFLFKKQNDGTIDKTKVVCSICQVEFSYHRSSSSLTYHLNAKHPTESRPRLDGRQPTLHDFSTNITRPVREKVTNALAVWVARDCRPINIVEDGGLTEVIVIASGDNSYGSPSRGTIVSRIHSLYDGERARKIQLIEQADSVTLTGDHSTSVSNDNYLGVTAHFIDNVWKLRSFALEVKKNRRDIQRRTVQRNSSTSQTDGR